MKAEVRETIIYGGAFNPPTLAHQAILQACIDYAEPRGADVWLLLSGSRKDKTIAISPERRRLLCDALLADIMKRTVEVDVCTRELERSEPTETYRTVRELEAAYPDRMFTWVFGSDSIATMPQWRNGVWLKNNLSLLVVDRPDSPEVQLRANALWLAVDTPIISSTEVRGRIYAGEPYDDLVGEHVYAALRQPVLC